MISVYFFALISTVRYLIHFRLAKLEPKVRENIYLSLYYTLACIIVPHSVGSGFFDFNEPTSHIRLYYGMQISFYLVSIAYMVQPNSIERQKKDYNRLLVHHGVTLFLIVLSQQFRYHNLGVTIMFLHDLGDIALSVAKACHNQSQSDPTNSAVEWGALVAFAAFVVLFFVGRLVVLPYYIILPCVRYASSTQHAMAVIGLIVLWVLHLLWFRDIARMIWKLQQSGGKTSNVHED